MQEANARPTLVPMEGQTLVGGKYRLLRDIGGGGFGRVFLAKRDGKERAVKVMAPDLAQDPANQDRFFLDAKLLAEIDHPHVVDVVDYGIDETTRQPWVAMEYLHGFTLDVHVRQQGVLWAQDVRAIVRQLGDGMRAVHRRNVIHRDLKPQNIMICESRRSDVRWTLKVIDFGVSLKLTSRSHVKQPVAVLSLPWAAPEQHIQGAEIRPQTDVWAIGLIVYWLFTGRIYWQTTGAAFLEEMKNGAVEAASVRARMQGNDGRLPPKFDGWFAKCVAPLPKSRYADADAAFAALESVMADLPANWSRRSEVVGTDSHKPDERFVAPSEGARESGSLAVIGWLVIAALVALIVLDLLSDRPVLQGGSGLG